MANYPTQDPSFTVKSNGQTIDAAHIDALQDEVTAIGSALRGTLQHSVSIAQDLTVAGKVYAPAQPTCAVYSSVTQSLATLASTGARVTFGTKTFDVGAGYSTATSLYTAPSSGLYYAHALVKLAAGAQSGNLYLSTASTGFGTLFGGRGVSYSTAAAYLPVTGLFQMNAGETLHVQIVQNSTEARVIGDTFGTGNRLQIVKLW